MCDALLDCIDQHREARRRGTWNGAVDPFADGPFRMYREDSCTATVTPPKPFFLRPGFDQWIRRYPARAQRIMADFEAGPRRCRNKAAGGWDKCYMHGGPHA